MCGIVGVISKHDTTYVDIKKHFMKYALAVDTLRGEDSTGMMIMNEAGNVQTKHSILPGINYVNTKAFESTQMRGWAVFGHNRAATKGSVKRENAHPFTVGPITLMHNGTLYAGGRSLKTYDDKLEVDSMQIALALSESPPEDAAKVLEQVDGSFALIWFDARNQTCNIARNSERPLHFCYNTQESVVWFMSDASHLASVTRSFKRHAAGGGTIYALDKFRMLTFKKGSIVPTATGFKEFKRTIKPTKSYTNNKGGGGAVDRAARKWKNQAERHMRRSKLKEAVATVVNGKKRKVPRAQAKAIESMFGMKTTDEFEFVPLLHKETQTKKHTIVGNIMIPEWGDAEYAAVIRDIPQVEVRAYWKQSWTVRPVGLTVPLRHDGYENAILCDVVNWDYEKYGAALREAESEEDNGVGVDLLIPGIGGRMMRKSRLYTMLSGGCISCQEELDIEEVEEMQEMNEGRDVLCPSCVEDIEKAITKH